MARIKGNSITEIINPKVKLVSVTNNPAGTLFAQWTGSRFSHVSTAETYQRIYDKKYNPDDPNDAELIEECCEILTQYPEYWDQMDLLILNNQMKIDEASSVISKVIQLLIKSDLPPLETVQFVLQIDDANVAWRDQLVRGRLPQTFWTQTSRTAELSTMDTTMSPSIEQYGGEEAVDIYRNAVQMIRDTIGKLTEMGVPVEDIRLQPQTMLHRVYWTVSARVLKTIIPKRTSWIAQATLWSPIIKDIIEIVRGVLPEISNAFGVPADVVIRDGKVISHKYQNENDDRYYGKDPQPVDPLYLMITDRSMPDHTNLQMYDIMKSYYISLWNDEILDMLGWSRENPSQLGPYDRPKM